MKNKKTYFGSLIILGKSNTGKSTLLNRLMNKNISITSFRTNSTKNCITGIKTDKEFQCVYLDTPGTINNIKQKEIIKRIIKTERKYMSILYLTKYLYWDNEDFLFLKDIKKYNIPVILLINKIDTIKKKENILSYIKKIKNKFIFSEIIPISSKTGENIDRLISLIKQKLLLRPHIFPKNYTTHSSVSFMISEITRKKILFFLKKEIPYNIQVLIKKLKIIKGEYYINAVIKTKYSKYIKILIGKNGSMIKKLSTSARKEIQIFLKKRVHFFLTVI
ncbi:GTPase Era [Buchnera aphidicola (Mindarus keteleerifoliae)]|uniref:GTPase Era n=1 Tax=Buchnera aphidicola TaxID=9 RepID=UPI0031B6C6A8